MVILLSIVVMGHKLQTTCILDLMMMRNHLLKLLQVGQEQLLSDAISKNVWYHVSIIQNLSNIRLFVNGTNVITHDRNTTDLKTTGAFTIGSGLDNSNNDNNFHGLIGPVRVFALI